jgi:hypothetical protein
VLITHDDVPRLLAEIGGELVSEAAAEDS